MGRPGAYLNNFFWLFLTYLLAPLFYLLIALRKKNAQLKILVIQTAKIGDLVCTTPVFREIKKQFPNCFLAALVLPRAEDILRNNPHLDETILLPGVERLTERIKLIRKLRKEKYDWVFNVLPDSFNNIIPLWSLVPNRVATTYKGGGEIIALTAIFNNYRLEYRKHTLALRHYLNLLKFIGIKDYSEEKEIFLRPEEEQGALNFLKTQNLKSDDLLVGISVTSGVKLNEWPPDRFAKLADRLIEELQAKIIFIGSGDERSRVEEVQKMMGHNAINSCGNFRLYELPALLKKLKLFISVDTGPLYMANTVGTPVIDIVGPDNMQEQRPSGNKCKIVQKNIDCAPCLFIFLGVSFCKEGHLRCVKEITVEEVFQAAQDLIKTASYGQAKP